MGRAPARLILIWLCGLALLAAPRALGADGDITVEAAVDATSVYVGEPFRLHIIVTGARAASDPDISGVGDDLHLESNGVQDASQTSINVTGGRVIQTQVNRLIYEYKAIALKAGPLTIPSIPVSVEGKTLRTDPVRLVALEPEQSDSFHVRMTLDKTKLYVGEPARLRIVWYVGREPRTIDFAMPQPAGAFDLLDADTSPPARGQDKYQVDFLGRAVTGDLGTAALNGRNFRTLTIEQVVIPRRAGALSIGPLTVSCDVVVGRRPPSGMFDNPFDDRAVTRRYAATAPAIDVQALPLPTEGRPADFNGLVGAYSITTTAEPRIVHVGDPITLTVRVAGPRPLDRVPDPALDRQPEITSQFKVGSEAPETRIEGDAKVFVQTIRALSDGVREIPPIELAYFDVGSGTYRSAKSAAIPLDVKPTREVTVADAYGAAGARAGNELESVTGGIAYNYESPEALADQRFDLVERLTSPGGMALLATPAAAYLLAGVAMFMRRRSAGDGERRRRRRALSDARTALRAAADAGGPTEVAAAVSRSVSAYIAARLGASGSALTAQECARALRERGAPESEEVHALMERCDTARFGALDATEASGLPARAADVLGRLDGSLRRSG